MVLYKNLVELIEDSILKEEGVFCNNGALVCKTGKFTGRSPDDKFIVCDELTEEVINWGKINHKISQKHFNLLHQDMLSFSNKCDMYQTYASAGALKECNIGLDIKTSLAWHAVFCQNLFIKSNREEVEQSKNSYKIICIPHFEANPLIHGTRSSNFTVINLKERVVLIGGTYYAGEIKKSVFTIFNYILPIEKQSLSMHCSATVGKNGDTALFFGLSGTGKTTLSADPRRLLIGDDEHGWQNNHVFNIEGGCYAKVINLTPENEPDIYNSIQFGSILENVVLDNKRAPEYFNSEITENTRVAYSLETVEKKVKNSIASYPKNIFFLCCDAFGVIPPVSLLDENQAIYYFLSGYTSKIAGTEMGIKEPIPTFSACFGAAFLPLDPIVYANMLKEKISKQKINVWLINTGWVGGKYGKGERISIKNTRTIIDSVFLNYDKNIEFELDPYFSLKVPKTFSDISLDILFPDRAWKDLEEYKQESAKLIEMFQKNFEQFEGKVGDEIIKSGPSKNNF